MHSHDLDTIAALADGSLEPERQDAARRLLDYCEECREEFEAQTMIIDVLSETEPATLTDIERARLHQTIGRLAPEPAKRGAWMMWLPRVAVAAAAVAFVGTFGVLFLGGGDTAINTAADAPDAALSTEAPVATDAAQESAEALSAEETPTDAAAGVGAADDADEQRPATVTMFADLGDLGEIEELTPGSFTRSVTETMAMTFAQRTQFSCLSESAQLGMVTIAATATLNGEAVEVFEIEQDFFVVLEPEDCDELSFPGTGSN